MLMLEGMTAKRASGSQTARQKAAVIKAARLEKEKQIMGGIACWFGGFGGAQSS